MLKESNHTISTTQIITATRKLDTIISRMREVNYDPNTLHGQFIAAHEELKLALKRHDAAQARTTIGKQLMRGTDLLPKPAA